MRCHRSRRRLWLCMLVALGAAGTRAVAQVAVPPSTPLPAPTLALRPASAPFDAHSLAGWTVDPRATRPPATAGGVLSLDDETGWLRTDQTAFGTFTLRFSARIDSPKARPIVAFLGTSSSGSESGFAVLLSGARPDPQRWPSARLNALVPDDGALRAAWSAEGWQRFELIRLVDRAVLRLNERVVLNIDSPVTLDGWIGFRVQDGTLEIREVELGPAPRVAAPTFSIAKRSARFRSGASNRAHERASRCLS